MTDAVGEKKAVILSCHDGYVLNTYVKGRLQEVPEYINHSSPFIVAHISLFPHPPTLCRVLGYLPLPLTLTSLPSSSLLLTPSLSSYHTFTTCCRSPQGFDQNKLFMGLTATTGQLADNHDILGLSFHTLEGHEVSADSTSMRDRGRQGEAGRGEERTRDREGARDGAGKRQRERQVVDMGTCNAVLYVCVCVCGVV